MRIEGGDYDIEEELSEVENENTIGLHEDFLEYDGAKPSDRWASEFVCNGGDFDNYSGEDGFYYAEACELEKLGMSAKLASAISDRYKGALPTVSEIRSLYEAGYDLQDLEDFGRARLELGNAA